MRTARQNRGWNQQDLAGKLGVSQGYVSLMEASRRPVSRKLAAKLVSLLSLSPSALPVGDTRRLEGDRAAGALGRLGYPGFSYLRHGQAVNPAAVLLGTLLSDEVDARVVEGLPWVVIRYADMDWDWLVSRAKQHDCQNRLGFVVTLARMLAETQGDTGTADVLRRREAELEYSRLQREDTFSRKTLTNAERRWLATHRSSEAERWNLLTNLSAERLTHA